MKRPSIQMLPSISASELISNAEAAGRHIAFECRCLAGSRDAAIAEQLAIAADGLRRELLRTAQALRSEKGAQSRAA